MSRPTPTPPRPGTPRLVPVWGVIWGWLLILAALIIAILSWSAQITGREVVALVLALAGTVLAGGRDGP